MDAISPTLLLRNLVAGWTGPGFVAVLAATFLAGLVVGYHPAPAP
jgi:hypothetical protein